MSVRHREGRLVEKDAPILRVKTIDFPIENRENFSLRKESPVVDVMVTCRRNLGHAMFHSRIVLPHIVI